MYRDTSQSNLIKYQYIAELELYTTLKHMIREEGCVWLDVKGYVQDIKRE